jgi:hypothetical protein
VSVKVWVHLRICRIMAVSLGSERKRVRVVAKSRMTSSMVMAERLYGRKVPFLLNDLPHRQKPDLVGDTG